MIHTFLRFYSLASLFCLSCIFLRLSPMMAQHASPPLDKQSYLEARRALVKQDQAQNIAASMPLSAAEERLDATLRKIQRQELTRFKNEHFFPPARYFFDSKEYMEKDKLFHIFKRMPKGAIHHVHSVALGQVEWVMEEAFRQEHCYVYWGPTQKESRLPKGMIRFFKPSEVPAGFVKASTLKKGIPDFQEQWYDLLTLSSHTDGDSVDIWEEFEHYFGCIYQFVQYKPVYKRYYEAAYRTLLEDGIHHIEARMGMLPLYDLEKPGGYYTVDSSMVYQREILQSLRQEYPNFTLRIIYTNVRFLPNPAIQKDLIKAYQLRNRHPDLIAGYDLVAEEDAGRPTVDMLDVWLSMDSLNQVYGREMPLFLHDGESNWMSNDNLFDAILLQSKRIGHAYNLYRYPVLWEKIKEHEICLEICPLSNQILGYVRDLRNHPAALYLKLGLPISISSDDPATFDYEGVTPDYWSIFYAWELDLRQMKQLCKNGLLYSTLDKEEKERAILQWEKDWEAFVDWANEELD